jgi:hypothetical protein
MKLSLLPLDIFPGLAPHHCILTHLYEVDPDASSAVASQGVEGSDQVEMVLPDASEPRTFDANQGIYANVRSNSAVVYKKQACSKQRRPGSCEGALQSAQARLCHVFMLWILQHSAARAGKAIEHPGTGEAVLPRVLTPREHLSWVI